jgi:glc operon protein GlcG
MMSIASIDAQRLVASGLAEASRRGLAVSVAVVDNAGFLVAFGRSDEARPFTVDVAMGKAYSVVFMGRSSAEVRDLAESRPHFFEAVKGLGLRIVIPSPGGIAAPGGAIGVSGAPDPDQDVQIAIGALEELGLEPSP